MATLIYSMRIQTIDEHGRWVICTPDHVSGTMGVEYLDKSKPSHLSLAACMEANVVV